jgi:small subunit ribosomal protein S3
MGVQQVHVNIEEIRKPEIDAQLIADSIAQQLEKRIMFRRAMKRAMQNAMRLGAQGIKIMSAGRLNGIEIARTEWYREGRVPLHTLRADIDYGMGEAKTNYGVIGIKVWVYKGEVIPKGETALLPAPATPAPQPEAPAEPKRPRKPFPKAGAKRAPAKPRPEGERKAKKADAAPAPKTTVKKPKKIVKDEGLEKKE